MAATKSDGGYENNGYDKSMDDISASEKTHGGSGGTKLGPRKILVVMSILVCELCERLTYYSVVANLVLYCTSVLKYSSPDAASILLVFQGVVYLIPVAGGYIADAVAGRYNTIFGAAFIYMIGLVLLPASAIDYRSVFGVDEDGSGYDMTLMNQTKTNDGRPRVICPFCPKLLVSNSGLLSHIHAVHKTDKGPARNTQQFHCNACSFTSSSEHLLGYHLKRCHGNNQRDVTWGEPPVKAARSGATSATASLPEASILPETEVKVKARTEQVTTELVPVLEITPKSYETIDGPEIRKKNKTPVKAPKKAPKSVELVLSDSSSSSSSSSSSGRRSSNSSSSLEEEPSVTKTVERRSEQAKPNQVRHLEENISYIYKDSRVAKQIRTLKEWYTTK